MIRTIPAFFLEGNQPRKWGQQHGEVLRSQVKAMAEIRLELMCKTSEFTKPKEVIALAEEHLPVLQAYDSSLFDELEGISEASNVSLPLLVVLNHYTDMRDIKASFAHHGPETQPDEAGGCSVLFVPNGKNPILGQTWDIHGSALDYVCVFQLPGHILFSVAGCLGMTGLNDHGVGICINNLNSHDAHVGLLWPALVRACLKDMSAEKAKDRILHAPLGSGHHYAVADRKSIYGIETSGTKKKIIFDDPHNRYIHTNHCLDQEMERTSYIRPESTTLQRFAILSEEAQNAHWTSADDVFVALASVSAPQDKKNLDKTATCGSFVMELGSGHVCTSAGSPSKELLSCPSTKLSLPQKQCTKAI